MTTLLNSHLEQIALCGSSIAELPFAGPKAFTNALLASHDITTLIRDTEQHERALFHLAPPSLPTKAGGSEVPPSMLTSSFAPPATRRATMYGSRQPKNRAVAAVLGGALYERTRRPDGGAKQKGELDVEVLLEGAEKLAAVYPIPGAADRIAQLRRRYLQLTANIAHYEAHVAQQAKELSLINPPSAQSEDTPDEDIDHDDSNPLYTRDDIVREETEIGELEKKKRALEDRVTGMERDLGGLMR